ncbi:MAG: nucleotidyltransferase family protein [Thermodesulfobacteriota bacterium]
MPIVNVEGLILAAGFSRRMGFPKLEVEIDGMPLLERVVRAALESTLCCVVVVQGPQSPRLFPNPRWSGSERKLKVVVNPEPERGMSSSMRIGLGHVNRASDGVMILLGDQPRITGALIDELVATFGQDPGRIVYPTIKSRRTTPAVLPRPLFAEMETVRGDKGAREVIQRHPELVRAVEMGDRYDDRDIDSPDDLSALVRR